MIYTCVKYQGETALNNHIHLKNEGHKNKTGCVCGGGVEEPVGGGRVNTEGE
jgi:hypothetical protein